MHIIKELLLEEKGQGQVEYGLLLAAIVAVVVIAVPGLREMIMELFQRAFELIN